jgi:hypothetical protein
MAIYFSQGIKQSQTPEHQMIPVNAGMTESNKVLKQRSGRGRIDCEVEGEVKPYRRRDDTACPTWTIPRRKFPAPTR